MADKPQSANGAASGPAGSRPSQLSRGASAAHSSDAFFRLLVQDQTDSSDTAASATAGDSRPAGAGSNQRSAIKKSGFAPLSLSSTETQATARRKQGSDETGPTAQTFVTPSLDQSPAARWLLALMRGEGSAICTNPEFDAPPSITVSAQESALVGQAQAGNTGPVPALLFDQLAIPMSSADNAVKGATPGTLDSALFAELSLTPIATADRAAQAPAEKPICPPTFQPADAAPIKLRADSNATSKSEGATEGMAVSETLVASPGRGEESSPDQSAGHQKATFAVSRKKVQAGGIQIDASAVPSDPGGNGLSETMSPVAIRPAEYPSVRTSDEAPSASGPAPELAPAEPAKPFGSSVGSIELQIKVTDEKQVGIRFIERQGQVEIQMRSGDAQTVKALSDDLAGLKTSLTENGWDVESRVQGRISPVGQGSQSSASAERGSSPLAQFEPSSLAGRASLNPLATAADPLLRQAGDHFGSPQMLRTEQASTGQTSRQGSSDSSSGQDQSHPDRDGSSNRNGQQSRNDGRGAEQERQGRRSARDSEAWLESMESNLTRSSSGRVTTGATK